MERMKNTNRGGSKMSGKPDPNPKRDRKSGSGNVGSPKKGGHGGKFTWAGDGYSEPELGWAGQGAIDAKDPNFDEPEPEPEPKATTN